MSKSRLIKLVMVVCSLQMFSACMPVQGYPGPERPDSEISLIQIEHDSRNIDISEARTEGIEFGGSGIKVLPGKHAFSYRVVVKEPPDNCYSYPEMNTYGYQDCLNDVNKGKRKSCNCYDYMTIKRKCYRQGHDGNCSGDISTRAGQAYAIRAIPRGQDADVSVLEQSTQRQVGFGRCEMYGRRTVEEEESLGSGRYTANQNGIYSCY